MTSSPEVQAAVGDPARFGDLQKGRGGILPDTRTANFVGKWPAGRPEEQLEQEEPGEPVY
jgi:hypothetical protein